VRASSLEQLSIISKSHRKKVARRLLKKSAILPKSVETRNSEHIGAAARYRRATVGSSHGDAHPDNLTLHKVKFTLICCTSADLFFSCCDSVAAPWQRPGNHDQVLRKNIKRRRGHRLRRTRITQAILAVRPERWNPELTGGVCELTPAQVFIFEVLNLENILPFNVAWRAVQGQRAPSPRAGQ
jgi:hypothetical protein